MSGNRLALAAAALLLAVGAFWLPGVIRAESLRHPDCVTGYLVEDC